MTTFNTLQSVKRRFFAMRNGIVADRLRRAGSPYRIIFGLNLPQIAEIAADFHGNAELAQTLWENISTRESRLMAPMLLNPNDITAVKALEMLDSVDDCETADVLCHKLLRKSPEALQTASSGVASERAMTRYGAIRLALNLLREHPAEAVELARSLSDAPEAAVKHVAMQLLDEAEFLGLA